MKYLYYLITVFIFIQCGEPTDQGEPVNYDYQIVNSSGKKLTLFLYKDGYRDLSSKTVIDPGKGIYKHYKDGAPYDGFTMWKIFPSTDSGNVTDLEIIYNTEKRTIYHRCSEGFCPAGMKNIFSIDYNDNTTEVFEITSDDFQKADDCSGNCL